MTDISAKSFVQSQLGAKSGLFQELGLKPLGAESNQAPNSETVSDAVEKAKQEISTSQEFRSGYERDSNRHPDDSKTRYTVLVRNRSGEQRALSVKASSAEEAAKAAESALEDGEEVMSVSETTVPSPPDPNRGLVA